MKIALLVHRDLIPPQAPQTRARTLIAPWRTEYDVLQALLRLGHQVEVVGVEDSLEPLAEAIGRSPDLVFNLLEEFAGEAVFDLNIVAYLEMQGVRYTGCGGRGLALARDKATAKKIVAYHGVATPAFQVVPRHTRRLVVAHNLRFPVIVKYLSEESSMGIGPRSVVHSPSELDAQIQRMLKRHEGDILIEEYISGREIYIGILGNTRFKVLPARELHFGRLPKGVPRIASSRIKWNSKFRKLHGVHTRLVRTTETNLLRRLRTVSEQVCKALRLNGYIRLDFRIDQAGEIFFIEANPNPQICLGEDFADAAKADGWTYDELIGRILELGQNANSNPTVHN